MHLRSLLRRPLGRFGAVVAAGAASAAVVAFGVAAAPASALDPGAVSAPVPAPQPVTTGIRPPIAVPVVAPVKVSLAVPPVVRVGPIAVDSGKVAPGLGASVSVSPAPAVGVDVTLPTSVEPVSSPAGPLPAIHRPVGPGGATVATPGVGVTVPGVAARPDVPTVPGVPTVVDVPAVPAIGSPVVPTTGLPASISSAPGSSGSGATRSNQNASGGRGAASVPTSAAPSGVRGAAPAWISAASPGDARAEPLGSVNASLRHEAPESNTVWRAISAVATRQGLLIALAVLVLIARLAAGGLLRDALRRPRSTESA